MGLCPQCVLGEPATLQIIKKSDANDSNGFQARLETDAIEINQLKKELLEASHKLQNFEADAQKQMQQVVLERDQLKDAIAILNAEINELKQKQLQQANEALKSNSKSEVEALQQTILDLTESNEDWQSKYLKLTKAQQEAESNLHKKSVELKDMQNQLKTLGKENSLKTADAKTENGQLEQTVQELTNSKTELQNKCTELARVYAEAQTKLKNLQDMQQKDVTGSTQLQQTVFELMESNKTLENKYAELSRLNGETDKKLNAKSLELKQAQSQLQTLQEAARKTSICATQNKQFQQTIFELTEGNQNLQNKYARLEEAYREQVMLLNAKSLELKKALQAKPNEDGNNAVATTTVSSSSSNDFVNVYPEKCRILEQKIEYLSEELRKEINNGIRMSIEKLKMEAYVEQMSKTHVAPNHQVSYNLLTNHHVSYNMPAAHHSYNFNAPLGNHQLNNSLTAANQLPQSHHNTSLPATKPLYTNSMPNQNQHNRNSPVHHAGAVSNQKTHMPSAGKFN